jgi:hypothetical protein
MKKLLISVIGMIIFVWLMFSFYDNKEKCNPYSFVLTMDSRWPELTKSISKITIESPGEWMLNFVKEDECRAFLKIIEDSDQGIPDTSFRLSKKELVVTINSESKGLCVFNIFVDKSKNVYDVYISESGYRKMNMGELDDFLKRISNN